MSTEQPDVATLAATYFDAWRASDWERLATILTAETTFVGPMGTAEGTEACVGGLTGVRGMVDDIEVVERVVDGDDAITWFHLVLADGRRLPVANWSHAAGGHLDRIRVTFDPRPLLEG